MPRIKFAWSIRKPVLMDPPFSNHAALTAPPVYDLRCSNGYSAVMEKDQSKPHPAVYHAQVFDKAGDLIRSMWIETNLRDAKTTVQERIRQFAQDESTTAVTGTPPVISRLTPQ